MTMTDMIKRALYAVAATVLMYGCFADKGNYDFDLDGMNDFGDIEISPKPSQSNPEQYSYKVKFPQPLGTDSVVYTLKVRVKQTVMDGNPENLDYIWDKTYYNAEEKKVSDTETNNGDLNITFHPFDDLSHMGYSLKLTVYDRTTTLRRYFTFDIQPRLMFENSLFVLHGNSEHKLGNVAVIEDGSVDITEDAMALINPDTTNFFARTNYLAGATALRNLDANWTGSYLWTADSDGDVRLYNPFRLVQGHIQAYDTSVLLPTYATNGSPFIPAWVSQPNNVVSDSRLFMVDANGRLLISSTCGTMGRANDDYAIKTMLLYTPASSEDYTHDDREILPEDYQFTMVAVDRNAGDQGLIVGYDKKSKRFLYITVASFTGNSASPAEYRTQLKKTLATEPVQDTFIDYSVLSEELKLTSNNKEFIFLHGGSVSDPGCIFAYFLDDSGRVYRYQLTYCGSGGKTRAQDDHDPLYEIEGKELVNMTGVTKNTPFLYWSVAAPTLLYYAVDNTLYRYNTQSDLLTPIYEAPAGWTINKLKAKCINSNGASYEYRDENGNYAYNQICIGLYNGDQGAVAEIQLLPNGAMDESYEPRFFEGFERVHDFYFAYTYKSYELTAD